MHTVEDLNKYDRRIETEGEIMSECIFCKISTGEIPVNVVYENHDVLAFEDANPQAPVHVLVIPKKHFDSIAEDVDDETILALMKGVREVVQRKQLNDEGFRLVTNAGKRAGQTVEHLHIHILSGKQLSDSMA